MFVDDGYPGSTLERPDLDRLRDAAHNAEFKRLYVIDLDRLSRNSIHQQLLVEELRKAGIKIIANVLTIALIEAITLISISYAYKGILILFSVTGIIHPG